MLNEWNRPAVWLIGGIVLLGLIGAFIFLQPEEATEPAVAITEAANPTIPSAPAETADMAEETAVPAAEPTATADNSATILTGDDRSPNCKP